MRRRKSLVMSLLVIMLNILLISNVSATKLNITSVQTVPSTSVGAKGLSGEIDYIESIDNKKLFITESETYKLYPAEPPKPFAYGCGGDETGSWCENHFYSYVINYIEDDKTFKSTEMTKVIKDVYDVTLNDEHRVYITDTFTDNDTFYILGYLYTATKKADSKYYDEKGERILLTTKDGEKFSKVDMPDYELTYQYGEIYQDYTSLLELVKYNDTYVLANSQYLESKEYFEGSNYDYTDEELKEATTYDYYISKDLKTWTKKSFDINSLNLEKVNYAYIELKESNSLGAVFSIFAKDEKYETIVDTNEDNKVIATKDFNSYEIVTNVTTKAPSEDDMYKDLNIDDEGNDYLEITDLENKYYKVAVATKIHYDEKNNKETTEGLYLYISNPYGEPYKRILSHIGSYDWYRYYIFWGDTKEDTNQPIMMFITNKDESKLTYFPSYAKTDKQEYTMNLDSKKIGNAESVDGKYMFIYDDKYLILMDKDFKYVKQMKLPHDTYDLLIVDDDTKLLLLGKDSSSVMSIEEIYNAKEVELINLNDCFVEAISNKAYTGKSLIPDVKITYGSTRLKLNTDYKLSYKKNKNLGTATVTIKGIGKYTGTLTRTFKIVIGAPKTIKKSTQTSSSITLKWSKPSGSITGYEVYYSTGNGKYKKAATITKNKTLSYKKTKLSSNKEYYFKVRAYKTIGGKKKYSSYTNPIAAMTAPKTVSVKASANTNSVKLTWKSVGKNVDYDIYRSTDKKKYTKIGYASDTTYTDNNLNSGKLITIK